MRKKCLLLRHGSTKGNEEKRYIGCKSDEHLSEKGKREALCFNNQRMETLFDKDERRFLFVASGPMIRTVETAKILFPGKEIRLIPSIREIDFGRFEGKNFEELKDDSDYKEWLNSGGILPFPEGESREDYQKRSMEGFLEGLRLSGASGCVCIICHGGTIMSVMSRLAGGGYFDYQTGPLEGYLLETEYDTINEGIHLITYNRIDGGNTP